MRNGAFLIVFGGFSVLDSGFQVCVPECRPEKAVFQSAFAGFKSEKVDCRLATTADHGKTPVEKEKTPLENV